MMMNVGYSNNSTLQVSLRGWVPEIFRYNCNSLLFLLISRSFERFGVNSGLWTVQHFNILLQLFYTTRNYSSQMSNPSLTRATGCPVAHNKNSLTAGPHGPALLQDVHLIEKLQYFDRERTPPRNVHPLGTGAYGHFTVTNPEITKYTCASLFSNASIFQKSPHFPSLKKSLHVI